MSDIGSYIDGWTEEGTHVRVEYLGGLIGAPGDQPFRVEVDGEPVAITGRCQRFRDGGTTTIPTERGEVIAFRRLGAEHYDAFDGQRLARSLEARKP